MPFLAVTDASGASAIAPVEYPDGVRRTYREQIGDRGEWTVHDTWLSSVVGHKWGTEFRCWGLTVEHATALLAVLEGPPPLRLSGDFLLTLMGDSYEYADGLYVACGPVEREFVPTAEGLRVRMTFALREASATLAPEVY